MSHQVISTINPPPQVSRISSTRSFKPPKDAEVVSGTIELKMFVNENKIELKICPLVDAISMRGSCERVTNANFQQN